MATNTYVALETQTLGSAAASVTFTSIPQGYTDLVLVSNSLTTANTTGGSITVNGDAGSNYSEVYMYGLGSGSGASGLQSNQTKWISQFGRTTPSPFIMQIMNYSNTTTYKTALIRMNAPDYAVWASANMWRSTAAITSITLAPTGANWAVGATFTLYGIAAASVGAKATGGTIYQDSSYFYHVFSGNGTFTPASSLTADVLVVAGGGGGGGGGSTWANGGGGGAGGVAYYSSQSLTATGYTCTVGGAGAGGVAYTKGASGTNSSFTGLTAAVGGGAGGGYSVGTGSTGGSGGGGAGLASGGNTGAAGTSGQGNAGGNGVNSANDTGNGGGGGGAGGVGQAANTRGVNFGGNGGDGINTYSSWITTTGITSDGYIAGGGAGGAGTTGNFGIATAGGGNGGNGNANGTNGVAYTGGGGGGCGAAASGGGTIGGNGGSGLVIVRYAK